MIWLLAAAWAQSEAEEAFTFEPPGQLVEGSGEGREDDTIYLPGMRFPLERAPAYLNSQVHGNGGFLGPGGRQCDAVNYQYPWRDNFCESRRFRMPLCPAGTGHQGQDIRPATCEADRHWAVAAAAGTVVRIGSFSVTLIDDQGTEHRYLHLEPTSLQVEMGQRVTAGDRIGRVSNAFFDRDGNRVPTTIHLHYDVQQNLDGRNIFVPPYTSLVESYQALLRAPETICATIPATGREIAETEGCVDWFGDERFWRLENSEDASGGRFYWTNAHPGTNPANFARYRLDFEEAGTYQVDVYVVAPRNRSTAVPYIVRHAANEARVVLNQAAEAGWRELGVFEFAQGRDQWIQLQDNTSEQGRNLHISADSIRVSPIQP